MHLAARRSLRRPARLLALGTAVAAAAVLPACGSSSDGAAASDAPLVVVSTTQLADFARIVGGDDVEVVSLLQPNVDAHDFDPSPRDIDALARAAVIVRNGVGLDPWLDDAVEASGTEVEVVDASDGAMLLEGGHHHEDEGEAHAEDEGEAHAEEKEEEGHDHGDEEHDPHIWFDPANAEVMVQHVADAIVAAVPEAAADVEARTDAYLAELAELDTWIEGELAPLEDRKIVTDHEALTYYIDRYDLEFVGSIIPSFDTSAEVSSGSLNDLAAQIEEVGATVIFTEQSLPADGAETIARQTGVEVVSGEDGLYGDSLGAEGSAGATYVGMMRHNTDTIVEHLG